MNKKGVTIIELLISISMISVVILLLVKVMFSLNNINNDKSYASSDEIKRAEIIKIIENDLLDLKLNGIKINNNEITFIYENTIKKLFIENNKITYGNDSYTLDSPNASYNLCTLYEYIELENDYYLIKINIEVLIDNKNTTTNDDLILTYIGLKNGTTNYIENYNCIKK